MYRGNIFQPDGFPNSGGLNIPTAETFILPALFASGLIGVKGILHPQGNIVFSVPDKTGNVEGKPGIGPVVGAGKFAVDPEFRAVIAFLKMEDNPLIRMGMRFNRELPVVPNHLVPVRIPYTALGGFIGKGDQNPAGIGKGTEPFPPNPFVPIIKRKVSGAVKVYPGIRLPDKLRAGIIMLVAFHAVTS
jgi:hypothetical protein